MNDKEAWTHSNKPTHTHTHKYTGHCEQQRNEEKKWSVRQQPNLLDMKNKSPTVFFVVVVVVVVLHSLFKKPAQNSCLSSEKRQS